MKRERERERERKNEAPFGMSCEFLKKDILTTCRQTTESQSSSGLVWQSTALSALEVALKH